MPRENGQIDSAKIGILDSGVGGLSVLRHIHRLLPGYATIYFADQANLPYGPRDPAEIRRFVTAIAHFLLEQGAGVIVIACNAASAASLHDLRAQFPGVPIVGMEPAVKPAAEATQSGVIGVLTTQATADGPLYKQVLARYANNVRVITQVAPELVRIVEEDSQHTPESRTIIRGHLQPFLEGGADQVALACTHFPFLMTTLEAMLGPSVHLIDPGPAVARQAARVWPEGLRPADGPNTYFTSGPADTLRVMLRTLLFTESIVTGAIELRA